MATKLDKTITREVTLDGRPFTVTIGPDGVTIAPKRSRSAVARSWLAIYESGPLADRTAGESSHG